MKIQHPKQCFGFKNLTRGATKNSPNATKKIIKKAFLEPNLLNFECCSCVPTKLSLKKELRSLKKADICQNYSQFRTNLKKLIHFMNKNVSNNEP